MLSLIFRPSTRERIIVGVLALLVVSLGSLPWLFANRDKQVGSTYLGTNIPDTLDSQVYYSFIQANADGAGLYRNMFTSESQPATLFNPLWWVLGRVVAVTHWSPVTIFWTVKAVLGFFLVLILHQLLFLFFPGVRWRLVALTLAIFGGGMGGIFLLGAPGTHGLISVYQNPGLVSTLPVDVTYPAGFVWFLILHSPLYTFSITTLLLIGWLLWQSEKNKKLIHVAGGLFLLLGLVHPYDLYLVFGVGVSILLVGILGNLTNQQQAKEFLQRFGWLAVWSIPAVIYYAAVTMFVPAIHDWNAQNILQTSNLRTVVAGTAPLIFLVVLGVRRWWLNDRRRVWVPLAWIAASLSLMYFPLLQYQAKMIIGLSIPLAVLGTAGLQQVWERSYQRTFWRVVSVIVVGLSITTPGIFLAQNIRAQKIESRYFYASKPLMDALGWLQASSLTNSIILGDVYTGNLVPQYAERTAYLGHHHQTAHFQEKLTKVRGWFFHDSDQGGQKADWLQQEGIDYVVFGPYEAAQGSFDPISVPGLAPVFHEDTVTVFRVSRTLGE